MRYHTALSLGDIGDIGAVIPLIKALNDDREDVRRGIVESLGRMGDGVCPNQAGENNMRKHGSFENGRWHRNSRSKL